MNYTEIPNRRRNLAKRNDDLQWPDNARSALFLSFDFDAETAWFDADPDAWAREVTVSHGGYGARVGVPKLLELLSQMELSATFFVPGWVAEAHTGTCEEILKCGHEIGHHGAYHIEPTLDDQKTALSEIDRGLEILERRLGVIPIGYRAPSGENFGVYLEHLQEKGIRYSSSWRDDVFPYRHVLESGARGPVELPANYFFDDWMHGMIKGSGRNLVAREQVLSMWIDELEETHDWGGLTTTIFHPQVSGRPSRFKTLREFLGHAKTIDGLWIANGRRILDHVETVAGI